MGAKEVTYRVVVGGEHEWFNGYFEGLTWPFNILGIKFGLTANVT